MYILTVKAFADFDISYNINLAIIENRDVVENICKVLNEFCRGLKGCNQDEKLIKYLSHEDWVNVLLSSLREKTELDKDKLSVFMDNLITVCEHNYVYIYSDTFSFDWVMNLI